MYPRSVASCEAVVHGLRYVSQTTERLLEEVEKTNTKLVEKVLRSTGGEIRDKQVIVVLLERTYCLY